MQPVSGRACGHVHLQAGGLLLAKRALIVMAKSVCGKFEGIIGFWSYGYTNKDRCACEERQWRFHSAAVHLARK